MSGPDVAEYLIASPPGATLWMAGLGSSMAPLLRSGDSIKVLRCGEAEVRPGDIALVRLPDGALMAHVVQALGPLRTASLLGRQDAPGGQVLGRVVAFRRGSLEVPLGRGARRALWLAHQVARGGRQLLALAKRRS